MKRALLLFLLLAPAGCLDGGSDPQEPEPDDKWPQVTLQGPGDAWVYRIWNRHPIAVGGTQTYRVRYINVGQGRLGPDFDRPFTAVVGDESCFRIEDQSGPEITLRGVRAGMSTIRLLDTDATLITTVLLPVAEIE